MNEAEDHLWEKVKKFVEQLEELEEGHSEDYSEQNDNQSLSESKTARINAMYNINLVFMIIRNNLVKWANKFDIGENFTDLIGPDLWEKFTSGRLDFSELMDISKRFRIELSMKYSIENKE